MGIVTCGGLCPGLNDVIRSITYSCLASYKVKKVIGFKNGYAGLSAKPHEPPINLTCDVVHNIQGEGGTILGCHSVTAYSDLRSGESSARPLVGSLPLLSVVIART